MRRDALYRVGRGSRYHRVTCDHVTTAIVAGALDLHTVDERAPRRPGCPRATNATRHDSPPSASSTAPPRPAPSGYAHPMSKRDPEPLDPDQVECPRASCRADVGIPCRTATGGKARTVHMERRRAAHAGQVHPRAPRAQRGPTNPGTSSLTPEARSKGGKAAAQARARRRAEAAAAAQAEKDRLDAEALEREAQQLAEDAVRYDRDRAVVRRQTLDAAKLAGERLVEGLTHMHRPRAFDEEGIPATKPTEVYRVKRNGVRERILNSDLTPATEERPDMVGYYAVEHLETLAKVAASALTTLRLEEGKPTGIHRTEGEAGRDPAEILGASGIRELIAFAAENLPEDGGGE